MRRLMIPLAAAVIGLAAAPAGSAATKRAFDGNTCPSAPVVAYVTMGIQSDGIVGPSGLEWARGTYTRQIVIYRLGTYTFCVITRDSGTFTSEAGPSPGGTGWLDAGVTGTVTKSTRSTIFYGVWRPSVPTMGSIGTYPDGNWLPLFFSWTSGYGDGWFAQLYRSPVATVAACFNWSSWYGVSGDIVG
jgi:hypothetical protein